MIKILKSIIKKLLSYFGYTIRSNAEFKTDRSEQLPLNYKTNLSFSERFEIIPKNLVLKVNGSEKEEDFLHVGQLISNTIERNIPSFSQSLNILDFGCGLGRVLSVLKNRISSANLIGLDIDPLMLSWAKFLLQDNNCDFKFSTIPLKNEQFDLIIAISVFTHIDKMTDYWLMEIDRLLSKRGKVFITYQDESLFQEIAGTEQLPEIESGTKLDDYYVTGKNQPEGGASMGTFYSTNYWKKKVGTFFNIETTQQRGLFGHQSFSVLTKKEKSIDNHTSIYTKYIEELEKQLFYIRKKYSHFY